MKRAPTQRRPASREAPASFALALRKPARGGPRSTANRLQQLRREHERLLRDIAKKKAAFASTLSGARDAEMALEVRMAPLREGISQATREVREIFDFFTGPKSPLSAKNAAKVRKLYRQLMPPEDQATFEDEDFDEDLNEGLDQDPEDAEYESERREARTRREDQEHKRRDVATATKPEEASDSLLRTLFRKLAVALHPDKVQKVSQKDERTRIMKEVTRAYETSDLAKLLELERVWLADSPTSTDPEFAARIEDSLDNSNRDLRKQLRTLTEELKELKRSVPGMIRVPGRRGPPVSEADLVVSDMTRAFGLLSQIREFAVRFKQGNIPLATFLRGPNIDPDLLGDDESVFDDVLESMVREVVEAPRGRAKGKRR